MVDLVIRQRITTADPGEASSAFAELLGAAELRADGSFVYEQRSLVDDGITFARVASSAARVEASSGGSADLVLIAVRGGHLRLHCRGSVLELGEQGLALVPFNEPCTLHWSNVSIDVFSFPLSAFVRTLGTPAGGLTIRAPYLTSRSADLSSFWFRMSDLVARQVLDRAGVYANDVVRAQLIDGLTAVTIEAFGLTNQQEDERLRDDELLQRAEAYIRAHLHDPISVPDIAAGSDVSIRGLQVAFQRRLDSTPIAYLRRRRLEAARLSLMNPAPGTTVGEVGRSVGYSNLGRFSAHYRDEFHEAPSRTLERARPRG